MRDLLSDLNNYAWAQTTDMRQIRHQLALASYEFYV